VLRQQAKTFNYGVRALDGSVVILSFLAAFDLRTRILPEVWPLGPIWAFNAHLPILLLVAPLWILVLRYCGAYEPVRKKNYIETFWLVTKASFTAMMILFAILFITDADRISRLLILVFGLIAFLLLLTSRFTIIKFLRAVRSRGYNYRNILVVGTGKRARKYAEMICSHAELGLRVFGYVDDEPTAADQEILGSAIIGRLKDVPDIIQKNVIDEVVIALPRSWLPSVVEIVRVCEETGIEVTIVADFFNIAIAKLHTTMFYDIPLLTFSTTPSQQLQLLLKDCLDRVGAIVLLVLALPVFVVASIAIKLTSRGPILFKQVRLGLNGRKFTFYKFRSMKVGSEKEMEGLKNYNQMSGPVFKMQHDPRVTPVGRFLRRTSIDEIPQLLNVLKGEMSLVGPRPPLPAETEEYDLWQRRRLSVKPGMTCLWQINGRNNVDFKDWMNLDLLYIDNWSLWLDIRILLKTLVVVIKGDGAY
jgi:exopolysaccharide biosynthesis polyprenyl glycosylphosphotransferase